MLTVTKGTPMEVTENIEDYTNLMTTQEAVEAFKEAGLSEPTFHRRVRTGQIKSIMPPGRQRGALYPKDQVLAAIKKKGHKAKTSVAIPKLKGATFTKMRPEDVSRIAPIAEEAFGGHLNIERWSSLVAKNPDIGYMLISEEKAVGCGFIMPLMEEKILDILSKEVTPPTFPEDIQEYHPGNIYYLYARTICVTQKDVSATQSKFWGAILVRNLMKTFLTLGSKGIDIKKIYGRSDTLEGLHLMHDMGFTQIRTTTSHKNFVIDIETSGLDAIILYEKTLNQWRQKHEGDLI